MASTVDLRPSTPPCTSRLDSNPPPTRHFPLGSPGPLLRLWRWCEEWSSASRLLPSAHRQGLCGMDVCLPFGSMGRGAWLREGERRFLRLGEQGFAARPGPASRGARATVARNPDDSGRSPIYRCRYRPHIANSEDWGWPRGKDSHSTRSSPGTGREKLHATPR